MHLKNKPPVLVPTEYRVEIERLSKAALMDLAWSFATRCAGSEEPKDVMSELESERDAVLQYRA